ncbi:uracil-DNA glycosylase [Granulicatella elegans]|uniref:uracil-DNA glycosylase n=1 Tax=Granulicatella elegans TaxID=137732 RepID=UPI001D13D9C0|nr:uracil-DNA glycosylase [Granulicatella elegans]UEA31029.1 uracil-DNA glycosylase [Granulicatella elegans]
MTTWNEILSEEMQKEYYQELEAFVQKRRAEVRVFPEKKNVFNALELTPFESVKVVILGQDPYHGFGQAHGLSFSVQKGTPLPPSLKNIYKELQEDIGGELPVEGDLSHWAKQGVLLLNTVLTVEEGNANSHKGIGWEILTNRLIESLNELKHPVIFILWGKPAQDKEKLITNPNHIILKAPHPSPLSAYRGFFGSKPFSKVNDILIQQGQTPICWKE